MQDIKKVTLYKSATIKETFEVIDKGAIRIAIIVDDEDKVIGTISDGDARRGLLKGYTLECSIEELYFKTFVTFVLLILENPNRNHFVAKSLLFPMVLVRF